LLGGIIVGPMVLGLVSPDSATIKVLAELGIFFLMLHSGLETDPHELFKASKKAALVAIGGMILPFFGGFMVSRAFGQTLNESLFIAMGLSITAIAISVRLFKDYKITNTSTAHITMGAAVINDILALILFSIILSMVETGNIEFSAILFMLIKIILFFAIVIFGGLKSAKFLNKFLEKKGFTFSLIVALALGLLAEAIGLHMIIGAFLAGLFIREEIIDEKTFNKIEDRIYGLSYSFLGPIFFTSLAFSLDFTAITTRPWFLIAIILVAVLGKVIGSGGAALLQKIPWKQALIIGLAMNSRGAVELIIASIALKQGVIGQDVFSILVIMAFATTLFSILAMKPLKKYAK
ncbi:MAG: cation:proton antiporter, partial [bacterium]|nr:cation:proton antiporter [bacterium]